MNTLGHKQIIYSDADHNQTSTHNGRVLVITYVTGNMEWMPYNIEALKHISACHDLVEDMQILALGETNVDRFYTNAQILVVTMHIATIWLPMVTSTLDWVTDNFEKIEDMQIVEGVQ
tara:strand:- start:8505 stop:8858 length:354 start_codon:yes stop_codon:yes gene_type:complete